MIYMYFCMHKSCMSPASTTLAAVQRRYESLRREMLKDARDDRDTLTENESKKKKYRSRRQRVF